MASGDRPADGAAGGGGSSGPERPEEHREGAGTGDGNDDDPREADSHDDHPAEDGAAAYDIADVLEQLAELEATVTSTEERHEVRRTRRMLERVPGGERISKYTSRDIAEGFVGGIIFALPMLVEDGVFVIAEWFLAVTVLGLPVFLLANVLFVVTLTTGLLYYTDIREVHVTRPILGFVPRRLVGVLTIAFVVAGGMLFMWGRLHEGGPTNVERLSRVTVVWAAAAFGAALGDILPGESKGEDIGDIID